jgi:molecular chaperone Hsp33
MTDGVVRGLFEEANLKVALAVVTDTAREARRRHGLHPASAALLAQGLAAASLMASLQKGESRINLQLECDGPFRGFFVDAGAGGDVRGYVKNPYLDLELSEGPFRWRAALGNSGFLSVLRDQGTEYYRSSVELKAMNLADDLEHYFATSDQVPTRLVLQTFRHPDEELHAVVGVLIQALPEGNLATLEVEKANVSRRLTAALERCDALEPDALWDEILPGAHRLASYPASFRCTCSKERVLHTVESLGLQDLQHIIDTAGSTAVTCHFCATKHEVSLPDLLAMVEKLGGNVARG